MEASPAYTARVHYASTIMEELSLLSGYKLNSSEKQMPSITSQ
jgi:hypothetical protein